MWRASRFRENNMTRTLQIALAGAILAACCTAATAQTLRVRGIIEKVAGNVLTLKSTEGAELSLALTDNALIVAVVKASMADIKEGTFLGSAAMPDRKSTRLNSSHQIISYAVFCLKKKKPTYFSTITNITADQSSRSDYSTTIQHCCV